MHLSSIRLQCKTLWVTLEKVHRNRSLMLLSLIGAVGDYERKVGARAGKLANNQNWSLLVEIPNTLRREPGTT